MPTFLRDRFFTTLAREPAEAVVRAVSALIDEKQPSEAARITTLVRGDEGAGAGDVYDELVVYVDDAPPPTLKQLAKCRTTIVLEYPARLQEKRFFSAIVKRLLADLGECVCETGEGRLETSEKYAKRCAKERGETWTKALPAGTEAKKPEKPKAKPSAPGETESVAIYRRLSSIIEGHDPLVRASVKRALGAASDAVREYAAAVLEEGPAADEVVAQRLESSAKEIAATRAALAKLLVEAAD